MKAINKNVQAVTVFITVVLILGLSVISLAQTKTVSGGVLNGKAVKLPQPNYPPAARAVKAAGSVSVQVVVDESGKVISATAVSGHPLLRSAAAEAARKAEFKPLLLSGTPVKVSGVLSYNFPPGDGNANRTVEVGVGDNGNAGQTDNDDKHAGGPRLGKYHVLAYGAATSPPIHLGSFQLLAGGKYKFFDNGGDLLGSGNYSFDAGSNTVEWTSGIFLDNGWGGEFTIEREGKTHKIRLKSNTIGTNSTDSD